MLADYQRPIMKDSRYRFVMIQYWHSARSSRSLGFQGTKRIIFLYHLARYAVYDNIGRDFIAEGFKSYTPCTLTSDFLFMVGYNQKIRISVNSKLCNAFYQISCAG
ncbi:MAG: hypothetical protein ACPL7O_03440, partial [Armatimonadota bacterium]